MASNELSSEWRVLRSRHQLHPAIQARLKDLFGRLVEDGFALPEGYGLAGSHRLDLVLYLQSRQALHFELFASKGTVERDVGMLLMSQADVRVAIILDESVDSSVATAYFRRVGDNRFAWYWLSDFLDDSKTDRALEILRSLLDEARNVGGPLVVSGPSIAVNPASGPPFTKVSITAVGFHPLQDLDIFWDPEGLTSHLAHLYGLNDEGGGDCEGFVPHSLMAPMGEHLIRAIDTLGNSALASFDVSVAWPTPSVRVVPHVAKPGEEVTVVGGGAPPGVDLTVFLWQYLTGTGVATASADERGEFTVSLVVPWLLGGLEVLRSGTHRVSIAPTNGGSRFDSHTQLQIPPFSAPDVIEWTTGQSYKAYGIAFFSSRFRISGRDITWYTSVRNDNLESVTVGLAAQLTMAEFGEELTETSFHFDSVQVIPVELKGGDEQTIDYRFHRTFDVHADDQSMPMRQVRLRVIIKLFDRSIVPIDQRFTFPLEIWNDESKLANRLNELGAS